MQVEDLGMNGPKLVRLRAFADPRGSFAESWDSRKFAALDIDEPFVLDAVSISARAGTVRGLHFQKPPHAQAKLVRVVRGAILDVVVDMRRGSPFFGRHTTVELRRGDWSQLYVPPGFLHGFCTLEDDSEVHYKLSDHYAPESALGVRWDDPALAIAWPVAAEAALLADKDRQWPALAELSAYFTYGDCDR